MALWGVIIHAGGIRWLIKGAFFGGQFVNFTEIMARDLPQSRKEAEFVLAALRKVPSQYRATVDLQLLG